MSGDQDQETLDRGEGELLPPSFMESLLGRRLGRPMSGGMPSEIAEDDRKARRRVLDALHLKGRKLAQLESVLDALLDAATNSSVYQAIDRRLTDVTVELKLCRDNYSQIDRGRPFKSPGEDGELLAAIRSVTEAVANTKALQELLAAADALVKTCKAEDTKP